MTHKSLFIDLRQIYAVTEVNLIFWAGSEQIAEAAVGTGEYEKEYYKKYYVRTAAAAVAAVAASIIAAVVTAAAAAVVAENEEKYNYPYQPVIVITKHIVFFLRRLWYCIRHSTRRRQAYCRILPE